MPFRPIPFCCALLAAVSLYSQEPVAPEAAEWVAQFLQPHPGERTLACAIHPLVPALTFRLVYRAGYSVTVSMEQLIEGSRALEIVARVTPKRGGARPLLLQDREALPAEAGKQEGDASKFDAQVQGGFYAGEGEYRVELAVIGSGQRVCRKQWDIEVKPQKGAGTAIPPGTAVASSQIGVPRLGDREGSLTIFLNANLEQRNPVLLESIAAILERMPFRRVQVVAFSLDQRKELLREELTGKAGFERLADALSGYNPGTVSYGVLQDPAGHRDFLWKLLAKEGLRAPPDDVVVFAGYSTVDDSHVFVPPACTEGSGKPVYVYLEYALPAHGRSRAPGLNRRRMRGGMPGLGEPRQGPWGDVPNAATMQPVTADAISRVTRACSGKVFPIYTPADLAAALQKTDEGLSSR
jgi:hypothetical protein